MIEEVYVSFGVAELLKEKGFDIPCKAAYIWNSENYEFCTLFSKPLHFNREGGLKDYDDDSVPRISAPTHQMAMMWLREEYNLFICIEFDAPTFVADIYKMDEIDEHGCAKHIQPTIANCKTYEEAVEAALKYILKNLI